MQKDFFNQSDLLGAPETAYHTIYADHPYMAELGLSVFTTGQLYNWLIKTNSKGEFVNMKLINGVNFAPLANGEKIEDRAAAAGSIMLGTNICPPFYNDRYSFSRWVRQNRTGDYIKTSYADWLYYDDYVFSDINFSSYIDKNYTLKKDPSISDGYDIVSSTAKHLDQVASVFITMNDVSRYLPIKSGFFSEDPEAILGTKNMATYYFIQDVKNSKEGYIQWSGQIPFNLQAGTQNCVKTECVPFRLYLYDSYVSRNQNKSVAFNQIVVSIPKIDVFGRSNPRDGTGNVKFLDPNNDPKEKVAAPLEVSYNPATGKAESGTPQILVMLEEDIGAASQLSLEDVQKLTVPDLLSSTVAHAPTFGTAIPLTNQNGNPLQWAPQYKKSCRDGANEKFTITVYNHSKSSFAKGTIVLANRINGHWIIQALASDAQEAIDSRPKNWSFTYLMMNFDNFFSNVNGVKYDALAYENAVWNYYYNVPNNSTTYLDNFMPLQVTSWDFMSQNIGGLRSNNALSTTVFNSKPDGGIWEDYDYGSYSAPFFGCVFPEGYISDAKIQEYNNNHDKIIAHQTTAAGITDWVFAVDIPSNVKLFDNTVNDNNNPNGNNVGMFVDLTRSLTHLPADIALNASTSGIFGSPLVDYGYLYNALNSSNSASSQIFQEKVSELTTVDKEVWLHKEESPESSVFDLEPINPFKIQFRPLKMEIYDVFQKPNTTIDGKNISVFVDTATSLIVGNQKPIFDGVRLRHPQMKHPTIGKGMFFGNTINNGWLSFNTYLLWKANLKGEKENARFPRPPWSFDWMEPASNRKPAGAFGVIGSSCTVKILKSITFNTDYVLGMRSSFSAAGGPRPWLPSLGGQGYNYNSLQTTQLYVRIFQNWPKKQTVYDPAHFAVFHFNPNNKSVDSTTYRDGNNNIINNKNVFSDSDLIEVLDEYRRNKLLPCEYTVKSTIGIPVANVYIVENPTNPSNNPTTPEYFALVIDSQGSDYENGDTFKISGGNGVSPILVAEVDANKKIIKFNYVPSQPSNKQQNLYGYNYKPSNFLKRDDDFLTNKGGLQIIPDSVSGTGFSGRIVAGIGVDSPVLIDEGPQQVGQAFIQLTGDTNTGESDSSTIVNEFVDSKTVTVNITPSSKSSNDSYDLFFHFHNDCSHTFIEDYFGGPAPLENHVTVTMTPN